MRYRIIGIYETDVIIFSVTFNPVRTEQIDQFIGLRYKCLIICRANISVHVLCF